MNSVSHTDTKGFVDTIYETQTNIYIYIYIYMYSLNHVYVYRIQYK